MTASSRPTRIALAAMVSVLALQGARAQEYGTVPGAIPQPWTYQGSMQLQQQQQQLYEPPPQQQLYQPPPQQQLYQPPRPGQYAPSSGGAAPVPSWAARPPLPPERNPLLGRWHPIANAAPTGNPLSGNPLGNLLGTEAANMLSSMVGGTLQSACESMFGHGVIEFKATTLVALGRDGSEDLLNHVEYRDGGKQVVVVPRDPGSVDAMEFAFKGPDQIVAQGFGCSMVRVGKPTASSASIEAPRPEHSPAAPAHPGAILRFIAGVTPPTGGFTPIHDANFFISKHSADAALARAGFAARQGATPLQEWEAACRGNPEACRSGIRAMTTDPVAVVKSDVTGRAQMPPVPAGRYYVFAFVRIGGQPLLWDVPVELRPGANSLTLDQGNATRLR